MTPEDDTRTLVAEPPAAAPEPVPAVPGPAEAATPCPRCGTPLRPDQEWCLNCGAAARTEIAPASGWRAPVAIVGAVLTLALAGLVVAFLAISDDSDELARIAAQREAAATVTPGPPPAGTPTPAPTPDPNATPTPDPAATPDPNATPPTDAVPTVTPAPGEDGTDPSAGIPSPTPDPGAGTGTTPSGGGTVGSWPAGEDAFTVVLLSSPSRAAANKRARQLAASGTEVGVLDSDDYSSLRGGYWVVFSGQYDSRDAAESALDGLKSQSPGAYVRQVTPR